MGGEIISELGGGSIPLRGAASSRNWGAASSGISRRRQEARRLAQVDAEALIRGQGGEADEEARQREHDVILPDGTTHAGRTPAHWRRVALIAAKRTGKRIGLDTATRMAQDADFARAS